MIKPKKTLEKIKSYGVEPYARPCLMKLDSNENYFGPSPKVLERLKNIDKTDICRYPSYGKLYDILSDITGFSVDSLIVTNGADEALQSVINTYLNPEDAMITVTPSFSMPKIYAGIIGAEYIEIPYREKWNFPEADFFESINEKVKIILITSPNNPTGDVVSKDFLRKILKAFPEKLVILDETYSTYSGETYSDFVNEYENLVVIKSLSKDYALAGLRLGYIVTGKNTAENVRKVLSPYSVNNLAVLCAIEALSDTKYINFVKEEIQKSKKYLFEEFAKLGADVYPSDANFLLADFHEESEKIYKLLEDKGIIVKKFYGELMTCLRITVPSLGAAKELISVISPKKAVIFDMDGVLVDVSNSYRTAIQKTYEYFTGKTLVVSEIQEAKNKGGLNNDWDLTAYLINEAGIKADYKEIVRVFQEIYWNDGAGVINNEELLVNEETLKKLSETALLNIFTGRPKREALYTLKKFNLTDYFIKIITMDDLPSDRQKPDTLGLAKISKMLSPSEMIYLGDTIDDMKCASDFGITGVGVLPPSDKSDGLKDLLYLYGAKYVINNVNEVLNISEKV